MGKRHFDEALRKVRPSVSSEMVQFYQSWLEKARQQLPRMTQQLWIKVAKILQERLNIKVRITEKTPNVKDSAIRLLFPAKILGVNTVWLPDGSVQYIVKLPRTRGGTSPPALWTSKRPFRRFTPLR